MDILSLTEEKEPTISFKVDGSDEPLIVLSKGKFTYKGKEIDDVNEVYEKFSEWIKTTTFKPSN